MNVAASRSPWISVVAACILSGGLIAAATIDSHRASFFPLSSVVVGSAVRGNGTPPISQDAVWSQFRQQFLQVRQQGDELYSAQADVKMSQIDYSAKDDTFTVLYTRVWPSTSDGSPISDVAFLHNNGYGQYYGQIDLGHAIVSASPYITIK